MPPAKVPAPDTAMPTTVLVGIVRAAAFAVAAELAVSEETANVVPTGTTARYAGVRLASGLRAHTEGLRIEGHSDNQPIHNARSDSNWELSTARAADLVKLLITQYHFDPYRLSASGYAEFRPVSPNNTPEGRARNRRVDVVILNPPQPERFTPDISPAPAAFPAGKSPASAPSN
jgi:chemotaxis protein MotB